MRIAITVAIALSLASASCKKPHVDATVEDRGPVQVEPPTTTTSTAQAVADLASAFRRVNFAYDSSTLDSVGVAALQSNAQILLQHGEISIEVSGHCDERGTTDYNLALGQRRAESVKRSLIAAGVQVSRVQTISYGEEKPLSRDENEVAWAENRRAEFVIVAH